MKRIGNLPALAVGIGLCLAVCAPARADHSADTAFVPYEFCRRILSGLPHLRVTENFRDVTIEIEAPIADYHGKDAKPDLRMLKLLTTTDGTLRPLLGALPSDFVRSLREKNGGEWPRWDSLSPEEQIAVLQDVGRSRARTPEGVVGRFDADRRIHGLRVKDEIEIDVPADEAPMVIFGQTYGPGRHTISVKGLFTDIHYDNARSMWNLKGIELHVRAGQAQQMTAAEVSQSARNIMVAAGFREGQHVHSPEAPPTSDAFPIGAFPLPDGVTWAGMTPRSLQVDQTVAMGTKLSYEGNLVAELLAAFDHGSGLHRRYDVVDTQTMSGKIEKTEVTLFGTLTSEMLAGVGSDISAYASGSTPARNTTNPYKMSYMAPRFAPTYTDGLWGKEHRWVRSDSWDKDPREVTARLLDTTQYKMRQLSQNKPYGNRAEVEQINRWLAARPMNGNYPLSVSEYAARSYYNRPLEVLLDKEYLPPHLKNVFTDKGKDVFRAFMKDGRNNVYKMFLHDWSTAPFLFRYEKAEDRAAALKKINDAQLQALLGFQKVWMEEGPHGSVVHYQEVVRKFLKDSGIYEEAMLSFFAP